MSDKIQWKRSIQQDGIEQGNLPDPKKLVINVESTMFGGSVMFSIRNENLQRVSEFDIEPGWDYPLDNSLKKVAPSQSGVASSIDPYPDMFGYQFLFRSKGKVNIGMIVDAEDNGELYIRGNYLYVTETYSKFNRNVAKYQLVKGLNNIKINSLSELLSPYANTDIVCFASNVKCHVSKCYNYCDLEIDHYIEPKVYQDIVLDYSFVDNLDAKCIKHNGTAWVDDAGFILNDHDQQQLNSIKFVDDCIIQSYNISSPSRFQVTFDISE